MRSLDSGFGSGFGGSCGGVVGVCVGVFVALLIIIFLPVIGCGLFMSACAVSMNEAMKETQNSSRNVSAQQPIASEEPSQSEEKDARKDATIDRLNLVNYNRVREGMTYDEVRRILGPASQELASSRLGQGTMFDVRTVVLSWEGAWGKNCIITFQNGRVVGKAQFGLPTGEPTPDWEPEKTEQTQKTSQDQKKVQPHQAATKNEQRAASKAKPAQTEQKETTKADPDRAPSNDEQLTAVEPKPTQTEDQQRNKAQAERKPATDSAKWRVWTDSTGTHTIEARFAGMAAGKVILVKKDGATVTIPFEELSKEDQKWIKFWRN